MHKKLSKIAEIFLIATSAFYIVMGIIVFLLINTIEVEGMISSIGCAIMLFAGIPGIICGIISYAVRNSGNNRRGYPSLFICSQWLFAGVILITLVYLIAFWFVSFIYAITFSTMGWDKWLFVLYYLPVLAVMVLNCIAMGYYSKLKILSSDDDDSATGNIVAHKNGVTKLVVVIIETLLILAAYLFVVLVLMLS